MAYSCDCYAFNLCVAAAEELQTQMPLTQNEQDHSVLDSAIAASSAPEQPPPPSSSSSSSSADLEAKKQLRLLEELESALLPSNTKPKPKQDLAPAPLPPIGLGLGLGFEVIDETALVETLSLPTRPSSAGAAPSSGKNVKKQSRSRRRVKKDAYAFKHKTASSSSQEAPKKKNKTRKYSRKDMEALRFANVEKQRAFWNAIHAGLEPVVASEYDTLLAVHSMPLPAPLCNKKHAAPPPILSAGAGNNGRWRYMNSMFVVH